MKIMMDVPESTSTAFRMEAEELSCHLRKLAAVKGYECGELSQERAAELAGQSRQEFLMTLSRYEVTPFQGVQDDLRMMGLA